MCQRKKNGFFINNKKNPEKLEGSYSLWSIIGALAPPSPNFLNHSTRSTTQILQRRTSLVVRPCVRTICKCLCNKIFSNHPSKKSASIWGQYSELMLSIDMRRVGDDGGLIFVFVFMGLHKPITQTGLNAYGCGDGHVQIVTRTWNKDDCASKSGGHLSWKRWLPF